MNCPRCGEPVGIGDAFCARCGYQLQERKTCKCCGCPVVAPAHYCIRCGKPIDDDITEQFQTVQPENGEMIAENTVDQNTGAESIAAENIVAENIVAEIKPVDKKIVWSVGAAAAVVLVTGIASCSYLIREQNNNKAVLLEFQQQVTAQSQEAEASVKKQQLVIPKQTKPSVQETAADKQENTAASAEQPPATSADQQSTLKEEQQEAVSVKNQQQPAVSKKQKTKQDTFQSAMEKLQKQAAEDQAGDFSQKELNQHAYQRYKDWDALLDKMYQYAETMLPKSDFEKLQAEETEWLSKRDMQAKEDSVDWVGDNSYSMVYFNSMSKTTYERCQYVLDQVIRSE